MLMLLRGTARTRLGVAGAVTALCLTACGSTVQVRSNGQNGPTNDGLSAPSDQTTGSSGTTSGGTTGGSGSTGGLPSGTSGGSTSGSSTGSSSGSSSGSTTSSSSATGGATGTTSGSTTGGTTGVAPGSTVEIGAEYISESGLTTAAKAFGINLDLGPILQEEQAMIAYLNAEGGINKSKVKLVPFEDSTSDNASTNSQSACSKWTQDNHVLAAITLVVQASSCLASKNAIELQGYNTANTPLSSQLKSTPLLTLPNGLTLDRLASTYGEHMGDAGYFSSPKNEKLGVVYNDTPNFKSAFGTMTNALKGKGIKVVSSYAVPAFTDAGSAASLENAVGNAVLQFRSAGITHVMFLDNGTTAAVFFGMAANNQKYYPRYGLNGGDAATIFAMDENNAKVLAGSQVLGYTPTYDTYKAADYLTPEAKKCGQIYSKAGIQIPTGANPEAYSLDICDSFLYLKATLENGGGNTPAAFLKGRAGVLGSFKDAMTYGPTASPDGVRTARIASYGDACACFSYVGPKISL